MKCISVPGIYLCVFLCAGIASGAVINVPGDQPTIQQGIDAAGPGDTVQVADGTYTGAGNVNLTCQGKAITVMSANGPENCVIDGEGSARAFSFTYGETTATIIEGFTIQNCSASGGHGGGIHVLNSSPTVTDCVFTGNEGSTGGAISCFGTNGTCSMVITRCSFSGNSAAWGGAIQCYGDVSGVIIGGADGDGNSFGSNQSPGGADLCAREVESGPINAQFNAFTGNYLSDYYVTPSWYFNLDHCSSRTQSITQNVYVSPSGDNTNDGLTEATAFRTIHYAMRRIYATESNPLTVYVLPGTYSPALTGEELSIPLVSHTTVMGQSADTTIVDAEGSDTIFYLLEDTGVTIQGLGLTGVYVEGNGGGISCSYSSPVIRNCHIYGNTARIGAGFYCELFSDPVLIGCAISGNHAIYHSAGILCSMNSSPIIVDCEITGNTAVTGNGGVGIGAGGSPVFFNCLISGNESDQGCGGIGVNNDSSPVFFHCTVTDNIAASAGGAGMYQDTAMTVTHCIFWNNTPDEIVDESSLDPVVTYTDIHGGFPGEGNMNVDPGFTSGPDGDYYLCQILAGDAMNSPCLDTGHLPAAECFVTAQGVKHSMDVPVTRTDRNRDRGTVDLGYHYPSAFECDQLGTWPDMPSSLFIPGDECFLDLYICNPTSSTFIDVPVFLLLDVFGSYYFAPGFTGFDRYTLDIVPGMQVIEVIPQFYWPAGVGSANGLNFYSAMTDADVTMLLGEFGVFTFGWNT